jgi:hypothetical protein
MMSSAVIGLHGIRLTAIVRGQIVRRVVSR